MPRISDYEEYLSASMVRNGDVVVMLDAGAFAEPEETGLQRTIFRIPVRLPDGRTKTWTMNKTTRGRLAIAYGDDSATWANRGIRVQVLGQNVRGEVKQVLYGYPVEGAVPTVPPKEQVPLSLPPAPVTPSAPALPKVPTDMSPHGEMEAWIKRHPDLVGKTIPMLVWNSELALNKHIVDELVKEKLAYLKDDQPFLDEAAAKYIG